MSHQLKAQKFPTHSLNFPNHFMPAQIPLKLLYQQTFKHIKYLNGNVIQKSNKTQIRNNLPNKIR